MKHQHVIIATVENANSRSVQIHNSVTSGSDRKFQKID